jgi:hypothetical protein
MITFMNDFAKSRALSRQIIHTCLSKLEQLEKYELPEGIIKSQLDALLSTVAVL